MREIMNKNLEKLIQGYKEFKHKYTQGNSPIMQSLADYGQKPNTMVISCCDSRVDPALIFQCDPGDLFVVRNVGSIVPPYEKNNGYHGTSAALEVAVKFLEVENIIILGHSQCAGIKVLLEERTNDQKTDFVGNWTSIVKTQEMKNLDLDNCVKQAVNQSYNNCLTFPWIKDKIDNSTLVIHKWFFDIKTGSIFKCCPASNVYELVSVSTI